MKQIYTDQEIKERFAAFMESKTAFDEMLTELQIAWLNSATSKVLAALDLNFYDRNKPRISLTQYHRLRAAISGILYEPVNTISLFAEDEDLVIDEAVVKLRDELAGWEETHNRMADSKKEIE